MAGKPRGNLDLLLLAALARQDAPAHGYGLIEQMRSDSLGRFDYPEGTVYPALHELEFAGLVVSDWAVVGGRKRRTYALTPRGRSALNDRIASWREQVAAVEACLGARS